MAPQSPRAADASVASSRHGARRRAGRQVITRDRSPPRSAAFENYYQAQCIVPSSEWNCFLSVLRTPLPVVVRLNRTKLHWQELRDSFASDSRWKSIPWCPKDSVWQCSAMQYDDALRTQCAALNKAYALRFQEAASLVPPMLLDIKPSDLLLDLCAAPGSKTLECLELMREESSVDEGVVIANDADAERCFELLPLITRKARHPGTAVVLGSGAKFPVQLDAHGEQVLYDRIVCDVPCSGDGTLRKSPLGWKSWKVEDGLQLHSKQVQILCRGLHLLKPGGRLIYSTCSMNPMENESVVAAALAHFHGDVSILEGVDEQLVAKGLRTAPGLASWKVPDSRGDNAFFDSWEDVPAELRKPNGLLTHTMFATSAASTFPGRCIRLYPHGIDGSGFFITAFVKNAHRSPPAALPPGALPPEARTKLLWRARNASNRYEVVGADAPEVRGVADFYGLDEMPSPLLAEYNVKGKLTQLNLVNDALLHLLRCHLNCKGSPLLVSVGVPLFKLLDDNFMTNINLPSRWRPALEGCAILAKKMSRRALRVDAETLKKLLAHRLVPMDELQSLSDNGSLLGLEACQNLLGGAVIGLHDASFWAPCIITGLGIELYANSEELGEPVPVLLPPLRPSSICQGPGYVAFSKPAGLRTEDVLHQLQETCAEAELVSRLDKQTSGCLLIAATAEGATTLTQQFAEGSVSKTYVAIVWGHPEDSGRVDAPLALVDSGGGSHYRAYVADHGKSSLTTYRTLQRRKGVALVAVFPHTGRTHQIRCHMAHIGCPLVGDTKYGGATAMWCSRLPLHCLRVQAKDTRGQLLDVQAPLPPDFEAVWQGCLHTSQVEAVETPTEEDWQHLVTDLLTDSPQEIELEKHSIEVVPSS